MVLTKTPVWKKMKEFYYFIVLKFSTWYFLSMDIVGTMCIYIVNFLYLIKYVKRIIKKIKIQEFPLWLSRLRTRHCCHEDSGLIPGLTQWFKDLVLLWLWCRPGCSYDLTPGLGNSICLRCSHKKKEKNITYMVIYRLED